MMEFVPPVTSQGTEPFLASLHMELEPSSVSKYHVSNLLHVCHPPLNHYSFWLSLF